VRRIAPLIFIVATACESPSTAPAPTAESAAPAATASPAERAAQCRDVLAVVARAAEESKAITDHITGDGTQSLEKLSASAKQAREDVKKITVTDAAVAAARDRYADMLGTMSGAAAQVVAAARAQEFDKLEEANGALTKAVESEPALVEGIRRACATP